MRPNGRLYGRLIVRLLSIMRLLTMSVNRMRIHTQVFAVIALCLLIVACSGQQQTNNAQPTPSPKSEEKLPIPRGTFKHDGSITTKYDRFKDKTFVTLLVRVYRDFPKVTLFLKAEGEYIHQTPQPPETIKFGFYAIVHEWEFAGSRSLIVLAAGQRLDFGEMERVGFHTEEGVKVEELWVNLPFDKYLQLANAKNEEMQLRNIEFKLAPEHIEALRDFASRFAK